MLEEALLVFACINGTGCQETSSQYYATHEEVREIGKNGEQKLTKYVGPAAIQVIGPMVFIAAGGTGTVRIDKYFGLQVSSKSSILFFRKDY